MIESARSLDVTGVYTRQGLECSAGDGSIDIERVPERKFSPPQPKSDLRPEILATDLVCGSAITCKLSLRYLVENIGDAAAGPFATRAVSRPAGATLGEDDWPLGLAPQTSEIRSFNLDIVQTQLGEQVCVEADLPANAVEEVDEENNVACIDLP